MAVNCERAQDLQDIPSHLTDGLTSERGPKQQTPHGYDTSAPEAISQSQEVVYMEQMHRRPPTHGQRLQETSVHSWVTMTSSPSSNVCWNPPPPAAALACATDTSPQPEVSGNASRARMRKQVWRAPSHRRRIGYFGILAETG